MLANNNELWLAGRQASRGGWVRVSDGSPDGRVFYQSVAAASDAGSNLITLERPPNFGLDNPTWADGENHRLMKANAFVVVVVVEQEVNHLVYLELKFHWSYSKVLCIAISI